MSNFIETSVIRGNRYIAIKSDKLTSHDLLHLLIQFTGSHEKDDDEESTRSEGGTTVSHHHDHRGGIGIPGSNHSSMSKKQRKARYLCKH